MTLRFGQNLAYLRKINKLAQKDIAKIVNKTSVPKKKEVGIEPTKGDKVCQNEVNHF